MLQNISQAWLDIIDKPELKMIEEDIAEKTVDERLCPAKNLWFEWARLTALDDVKVVIIAQDPYYDEGTAHGLAFSSLKQKIPPSLKNIYKCLMRHNLMDDMPNHANLTEWAQRGILLLNASLSTELNTPNLHSSIWNDYTTAIMQDISNYGKAHDKKYVYLLWGNNAKKFATSIDCEWHRVLEWLHPSPMAQSHPDKSKRFIKCDHFTICNEEYGIDWKLSNIAANPGDSEWLPTVDDDVPKATSKKVVVVDPSIIQVFTDGSCINNGKKDSVGGFAAIFVGGCISGKRLRGKLTKNPTNIRAEGIAIIRAIERVKKLNPDEWKELIIYTDSEFWIKMLTKYIPKWNDDKFNTQANPDLTKKLWALWNSFDDQHKLNIVHVPAHNKSGWRDSKNEYKRWCYINNDKADRYANKARLE